MGYDIVAGCGDISAFTECSIVKDGGVSCWFGSEELVRPACRRDEMLLGLVGCS